MPPGGFTGFLRVCSRHGILLDTNLLVLLAVGSKDRSHISSHSRTRNFSVDDYDILHRIVKASGYKIHITPHVVAEVSNLLIDSKVKRGSSPGINLYHESTKLLISDSSETYINKDKILSLPELKYLGFTDLSIVEASKALECAIATDDAGLYKKLLDEGRSVVNISTLASLKYLI